MQMRIVPKILPRKTVSLTIATCISRVVSMSSRYLVNAEEFLTRLDIIITVEASDFPAVETFCLPKDVIKFHGRRKFFSRKLFLACVLQRDNISFRRFPLTPTRKNFCWACGAFSWRQQINFHFIASTNSGKAHALSWNFPPFVDCNCSKSFSWITNRGCLAHQNVERIL